MSDEYLPLRACVEADAACDTAMRLGTSCLTWFTHLMDFLIFLIQSFSLSLSHSNEVRNSISYLLKHISR